MISSRLALACCWLVWAPGAWADDPLALLEDRLMAIVTKARPSVVQVTGSYLGRELSWSGVVLDHTGHIVSAGEALQRASNLTVTFAESNHAVAARRIGFDPLTSLGVLAVDPAAVTTVGCRLVPITFGDIRALRVGALAIVVGNPFGLAGSISAGLISGRDRMVRIGDQLLTGMLQTTAAINPGDAGGLLANRHGELIGIVSSTFGRGLSGENASQALERVLRDRALQRQLQLLAEALSDSERARDPQRLLAFLIQRLKELEAEPTGANDESLSGQGLTAEGINFVLPADQVQRVARELIAHGRVRRGWLGAKIRLQRSEDGWQLEVEALVAGGPAEAAGLQAGDRLLAIGTAPITGFSDLKSMLDQSAPGERLPLRVRRGEQEFEIAVTLGTPSAD
jgi:S1-C subfamily serine protease